MARIDTEELYKNDLHDADNHDGVITSTHLELDMVGKLLALPEPEGNQLLLELLLEAVQP